MGWFDDNHPMGQAAEDAMDEAMDAMSKWQKDPPKATSSRTPKRVERPGAEWGEYRHMQQDAGQIVLDGTLTDGDLAPLEWRRAMNHAGYYTTKEYRTKEVEAASWAKHGGPEGLKAAKAEAKTAKNPARKSAAKFKGVSGPST
ncbi:hypothetical protein HWV62_39583 [Athelia sp. TMB]|nr:hypothetical protein HWV62_39583 [Athelia sp. TMB]